MRMAAASLLCCVLMVSAAVAQSTSDADSHWTAPAKDAAKKNPFSAKPQLAAGGEKVFQRSCAVCHGDEEHRKATKAPDLASEAVEQQSDGALFWKITNGNARKGMPSWGSIPEPQRWQLVLYIRRLKQPK